MTCEVGDGRCPEFRVSIPQWQIEIGRGDSAPIAEAFGIILDALPGTDGGCRLRLTLEIPTGAGLGSSAAISVAMIRALLDWHGLEWPLAQVNELAFKAECTFHGTPSGIDNTVATFGGFCYLADEGRFPCPFEHSHRLSLNKCTASLLREKTEPLSLVVIDTRRPRQTKTMVENVRRLRDDSPHVFASTMSQIGELSLAGYRHLVRREYRELGAVMTANHECLKTLGVSCPELDAMVSDALASGALGAKLTGAGGGGCLIVLAPGDEREIVRRAIARGFSTFVTTVGADL